MMRWVAERRSFLSMNCTNVKSLDHSGPLLCSGVGLCLLFPRLFSSFHMYFVITCSVLLNKHKNLMCKKLHLPIFF